MVRVQNRNQIVQNGQTPFIKRLREIALDLFEVGLDAVDPAQLVREAVRVVNDQLIISDLDLFLQAFDRIHIIGAGKASGAMAIALENILLEAPIAKARLSPGCVIIPHQIVADIPKLDYTKFLGSDHPIPSQRGTHGAKKLIDLLRDLDARDLVFCLISGGGSALLTLPAEKLTLEDLQALNNALLKSGATIDEINTVRKHVSAIKGGKLAAASAPATMCTFILSDVIGDPLEVIASGPTVPDPTTYNNAKEILEKYKLTDQLPPAIMEHLEAGMSGKISETPKPGDYIFENVHNYIIGNAQTAAKAVLKYAREKGWSGRIFSDHIQGEARDYAGNLAAVIPENPKSLSPGINVWAGTGELTVTIKGHGKGGRNQEMLLALLPQLESQSNYCVVSGGMDGIEGNSPAAGALIDPHSLDRARDSGLDPQAFLDNNDSFSFFSTLGDALITGYTGTNVNDLTIVLLDNQGY